MNKILIVEDDTLLAQTLEDILDDNGYRCQIAHTYESALDRDYENRFDLYLLDINLPTQSGIELLRTLRSSDIQTPAIFLTSHKDTEVLTNAFSCGCDDYIKKPFNNEELLCRIDAVLKRASLNQDIAYLPGDIVYDMRSAAISGKGLNQTLPKKLSKLLNILINNKNKVVTKDHIIEALWKDGEDFSSGSLRVYITKLKSLLGKESIENVKGVGYKLRV